MGTNSIPKTFFVFIQTLEVGTWKIFKEKLGTYFDTGKVWNNEVFHSDFKLKQDAIGAGYILYTICLLHGEPLALDKKGAVFCSNSNCETGKCPFECQPVPAGAGQVLFSSLFELFLEMGEIKD